MASEEVRYLAKNILPPYRFLGKLTLKLTRTQIMINTENCFT